MATVITEECINCGACLPRCPNNAIYVGGEQWELDGTAHDAIAPDIYYIAPEKCTECVGFFDHEECAAACPVDCCVPDPSIPELEGVLLERARRLHPEESFVEPIASRFRGT
jgi:ferredoxin